MGHARRAHEVTVQGAARARPDAHAACCSASADEAAVRRCAPPWAARTTSPAPLTSTAGRRLRLEGVAASVEARLKGLRDLAGRGGRRDRRSSGTLESRAFWRDVRDVAPLSGAARRRRVEDLLSADRRARHRRAHQGAATGGRGLLRLVAAAWSGSPCRQRRRRPLDVRGALRDGGHATLDPRAARRRARASRCSSRSRRRSRPWLRA